MGSAEVNRWHGALRVSDIGAVGHSGAKRVKVSFDS